MANKIDIKSITANVKRVCDDADALNLYKRSAVESSYMVTLKQLRDLYRHEVNLEPWEEPPEIEFTFWLREKLEKLKKLVRKADKSTTIPNIQIANHSYAPTEVSAIKEALNPFDFYYNVSIYNAGMDYGDETLILLAEIKKSWTQDGYKCYILGKELARTYNYSLDKVALKDRKDIFGRTEAARWLVWNKINALKNPKEYYCPKDYRSISTQAFSYYGLSEKQLNEKPEKLARKVDEIAMSELKYDIYHEFGHATIEDKEILPNELFTKIIKFASDTDLKRQIISLNEMLADTVPGGTLDQIIEDKNSGALAFRAMGTGEDKIRQNYQNYWKLFFRSYKETKDWGLLEKLRKATFGSLSSIATNIRR
jgi:hypothetical protein